MQSFIKLFSWNHDLWKVKLPRRWHLAILKFEKLKSQSLNHYFKSWICEIMKLKSCNQKIWKWESRSWNHGFIKLKLRNHKVEIWQSWIKNLEIITFIMKLKSSSWNLKFMMLFQNHEVIYEIMKLKY